MERKIYMFQLYFGEYCSTSNTNILNQQKPETEGEE